GTSITAARLFEMLKIPVAVTNDIQEVALDKLRRGEIAALAFVGGKPSPVFAPLKRDEGIHFLAIPVNAEIAAAYTPTRLSGADYPQLIAQDKPVETIAVGNILAVAELRQMAERSRNVANFVDIFFTGFQSLLALGHHPKWNEPGSTVEANSSTPPRVGATSAPAGCGTNIAAAKAIAPTRNDFRPKVIGE